MPNTSPISSFVRFGNDIQNRAVALIFEATEHVRSADERLESAKTEAISCLDQLDDIRVSAYERSVRPFLHLYTALGKHIPQNVPSRCQGERLLKGLPSFTASAKLHSRAPRILSGAIGGAIVGLAAYFLAPLLDTELSVLASVGIALFCGIPLSMLASYQAAKRNYAAAQAYAGESENHEVSVEDFEQRAKAIVLMSRDAGGTVEEMSCQTSAVVEQLTTVVRDSANAASLLRKILEMPVLDGEGALLSGVVEQLNDRKIDVQELRLQLAHGSALSHRVAEEADVGESNVDETSLSTDHQL